MGTKGTNYKLMLRRQQFDRSGEERILAAIENMREIHRRWAGIVDEPWKRKIDFDIDLTLKNFSQDPNDLMA